MIIVPFLLSLPVSIFSSRLPLLLLLVAVMRPSRVRGGRGRGCGRGRGGCGGRRGWRVHFWIKKAEKIKFLLTLRKKRVHFRLAKT